MNWSSSEVLAINKRKGVKEMEMAFFPDRIEAENVTDY